MGVRDGIRSQLLDEAMLHYLEGHAAINWQTTVVWQARPLPGSPQAMASSSSQHQRGAGEGEWVNLDHLAPQLEQGYHSGPNQATFSSGFNTFKVDYAHKQLVNQHTGGLFELRRLAFAPLMPLKVPTWPVVSMKYLYHHHLFFRQRMTAFPSTTLHLSASGVSMIEHLFSVRQ